MKKISFFLSVFFCLCFAAEEAFTKEHSGQELSAHCWESNCLKFGWSIVGAKITDAVENKCRDENCATRGWYGAEYSGLNYYTECIDGACFKNGYWILQSYTQKKLAVIKCLGPELTKDCLKYGWEVFGSTARGIARCVQNDCAHKGWQYTGSGTTPNQRVTCNNENCFVYGWKQSGG